MSMQHTPGPWKIRHLDAGSVGTDRQMVAAVYGDDPECEPDDRMHANARLIAAAPMLLEALQAAVECGMVPASSAADGGGSAYAKHVQVADQIRAAIAAATGSPR